MSRWVVGLVAGLMAARAGAAPPLARLGDTRYRPTEGSPAALAPDGRRLALTAPGAIVVWDLDSGRPAYRLDRPSARKDRPPAAVFTPDGKHLLTADGS